MSDIDFSNFLNDDKATVVDDKVVDNKPEVKPDTKADDELKLVDEGEEIQDDDDDDDDQDDKSDSDDKDADEDADSKKLVLDDDDEVSLDIPNRQKILKDFPELFKKHPSIEKAIYREQQYAEVFPHPKDAEQAKQSLRVLSSIETELGQGNIENLLNSVKKFDEKAFEQITESFLPTLQKLNQPAYFKTVNYVLKSALSQANAFGAKADKESDEYQIHLAAKILNKWIYNQAEVGDVPELGSKKNSEANPKEEELNRREKDFHQQALNTAVQEVDDRVTSMLNKSVENSIDPKGLMTPYVKTRATKDVIDQFREDLRKDKRFTTNLDRLWKICREDNYSDKAKKRIREAIKIQAKQVLPDIMRRVKADALKDYKKVEGRERKNERPLERRRPSAGNNHSTSKPNGKFQLPEGKTAREYLLED